MTVIEFADFQCPYCARQAADLSRLRAEYSGRVTFVFRNFPLPFHQQSRSAHLAALAAARQGKFWEMHDLIFADPHHLSPADLDRYAVKLGLDLKEFRKAIADPAESLLLEEDIAEGKKLGITATPTFVISDHKLVGRRSYGRLKQIIDAEIRGEPWLAAQQVITVDNAPTQGPASAPLTIVEFADFRCSFCARAEHPLHRLLEANPGVVRLVFKNFPLDSHPDSELAHLAALASGKQGKFWEMHDLIYSHQDSMKRSNLLNAASQLHLDLEQFEKDLENPALKASLARDKSEGEEMGVSATPTFVVNGEVISGFDEARLQAIINAHGAFVDNPTTSIASGIPAPDTSIGPADAPLKIEWYVDLTSELTPASALTLNKFLAAHPGQVKIVFKNFPLLTHPGAMIVHEFVLAAAAQGKFREVESLLLSDPRPKNREELESIASQVQLNQKILWAAIESHKYAPFISHDISEAKRHGISGTPTFLVGDRKLDGTNGLALFAEQLR